MKKNIIILTSILFLLTIPLIASAELICSDNDICYQIIEPPKESGTLFNSKSHYIYTTLEVFNKGNLATGNFIIELKPIKGSCSLLSSVATSTKTCDASHPENVYASISNILPGQSTKVYLKTPPLATGNYCAVLTSVDACCVRRVLPGGDATTFDCKAVEPFGWSTKLGQVSISGSLTETCGDSICTGGENPGNCAKDCGITGYYGDGYCSTQENPSQEPACALIFNDDNKDIQQIVCNKNNVCEQVRGESNDNCAVDCPNPNIIPSGLGDFKVNTTTTFSIIAIILALFGIIYIARKYK